MLRDLLLILLLSSFFFLLGNWVLSITSPDEGKNLDASLRMLETGDFIVPKYNCSYRFEKPPMFYWLTDLSFSLFGVSEFSGRLVSGISAVGLAVLVYLMGVSFLSREEALKASLVYSLLIHNWVESRAAVPEMLLTFFMTLGLFLFLRGSFTLGWLSLSFAFLTKGPVGVILPSAVYLLWKRDLRFLELKGVLLFSVLGLSWYLAMLYKFGFEYFYKFFLYENIFRFTGHKSIHPYPFWYYVPITLASAVLFLPKLPSLRRWDPRLNPFLIWFITVLIFYSVAKNKLHHYVLFLYPPLALMLSAYVGKRYLKGTLVLASLLLVSLILYAKKLENERFVPLASRLLAEIKPDEVTFYKTENSAIVFYTRRCIRRVEDPAGVKKDSVVIVKGKHLKELGSVEVLAEGKEFGKELFLVRVLGERP